MVARAQLIDITKGYIPVLPGSYPKTLVATLEEDKGEKSLPVLITDGQNFLPTYSGWTCVGRVENSSIPNLNEEIQEVLMYASWDTSLTYFALTKNGIFYNDLDDEWHRFDPDYVVSGYSDFSWCVVGDTLYMTDGTDRKIYRVNGNTRDWFVPSFVSSFEGVFKAGTRIGVWDGDNVIFWSAAEDHTDFTPSLTSLAGYAQFEGVVGQIRSVLSHGEGFVIYSDSSIVGVRFLPNSDLVWDAQVLLPNTGIRVRRCVCQGLFDTEHYVCTSMNLLKIQMYNYEGTTRPAEILKPDLQDYLLRHEIVYPVFTADRYLVLYPGRKNSE